ncbi:PRO-1 protein [Aphelenchoides avenae]|nr:PRO-1 protein [Aphelenchus avenae]
MQRPDSKRNLEYLLASWESTDPFSVQLIDPVTGSSAWSYKGSELQGRDGEYLLMSVVDKPMVHSVPASGELLSITEGHYQDITSVRLSPNSSFLVTASADGNVAVYLITDLVTPESLTEKRTPLWRYTGHSLAVRDMHVTAGHNPQVLTVSTDHTAVLFSLSTSQTKLKISADRQLTACAMDAAETKIVLGTDSGKILIALLYEMDNAREQLMSSTESTKRTRVLDNHRAAITCLSANMDGTLLASGDSDGHYCIWNIGNGQCLKSTSRKGRVATLIFVESWPSLSSSSDRRIAVSSPGVLHKALSDGAALKCRKTISEGQKRQGLEEANSALLDQFIKQCLSSSLSATNGPSVGQAQINGTGGPSATSRADSDSDSDGVIALEGEPSDSAETVHKLLQEVNRLRRANRELYRFAADVVLEDKNAA